MKKKIIALLLVLGCLFAFIGCEEKEKEEETSYPGLDPFIAAVEKTAPKSAKVTTTLDTKLGVSLKGTYDIAYNDDGTVAVSYKYDKLNEITDDVTDILKQVEGNVTIAKNGKVSGTIAPSVTAAAGIKFNFDGSKMDYEIKSGVLTAKVKTADTEAVLGVALDADAVLSISVANEIITSYTLTYETEQGPAKISCSYK